MQHAMIRDANVQVEAVDSHAGVCALITVNDEYQHQFSASSRISQQLQLVMPNELAKRLTGGDYFFLDDQLVDFRDQNYVGFSHSDDALDNLMKVIGYTEITTKQDRATHRMLNRTQSQDIGLGKVWSKDEIEIPMMKTGGEFFSILSFNWNPFAKNVSSVFRLSRVACMNDMVNTAPFINMQIPLVNRWDEHLEIANLQLQNKINTKIQTRLGEMAIQRASVADLMILDKHITGRLEKADGDQDNIGLHRMYKIVDPYAHLMGHYKMEALDNRAIAAQLPSHLTVMDAWNIATEVCTHYAPTGNSSDAGLQKLANELVFRRNCASDQVQNIGSNIAESPFSSPERAFFGAVEIAL
jgi:hypothetical protein